MQINKNIKYFDKTKQSMTINNYMILLLQRKYKLIYPISFIKQKTILLYNSPSNNIMKTNASIPIYALN